MQRRYITRPYIISQRKRNNLFNVIDNAKQLNTQIVQTNLFVCI